jgi:hypothetical protein
MSDMQQSDDGSVEMAGEFQKIDASIGDDPAAPTWPIPTPEESPTIPPVGLNWGAVAQRYSVDPRLLMHGSYIVLAGEYVPETGYFIDPRTLQARHVDVGQRIFQHGYLIGRLTADTFSVALDMTPDNGSGDVENVVVRRTTGPVIGLFSDWRDAARCRDSIVSGSIGSGVTLQEGPLGTELRVDVTETAGQIATSVASRGGAVISVGGTPVRPDLTSVSPQ